MTKDILKAEEKWWTLLGSFMLGAVILFWLRDMQAGSHLAIYGLASILAVMDFGLTLKNDRLEKRIKDLEYKTKEMK